MKKKSVLIAFFCFSNFIHAAGEIHGCVSTSLGGSIRHEEGASSLACAEDSALHCYLSFGNFYLAPELSLLRCDATLPTRSLTFGATAEWFGYELYHQSRFRFSARKELGQHWTLGYILNLNHLDYEGCTEHTNNLSCDLYLRYHNSHCEIYGRGGNLFGCGFRDTHAHFTHYPQNITIGCLIPFSQFANCTIEGCWERDIGGEIHIGLEYRLNHFTLRCGAYGLPVSPTFGIGFKRKKIQIDFAALWAKTLGYYLNGGIGYTFNQKKR